MYLQDSLSGKTLPIPAGPISIYACGITPYSRSHIGHARTYILFDVLAHVLRLQGNDVTLVRNITDIDDKIIDRAKAEGIQWHELSAHWANDNRELMLATGLSIPMEPKASEFLDSIFWLISQLLEKNAAYVTPAGDVYYRSSAWAGPQLIEHAQGSLLSDTGQSRVDTSGKENPNDFALWKHMDAEQVGFASHWGWGRPGWHIECSAMIAKLFEGSVTIHGGGVDLKFPHHQAEIMQSETVFGKPLADIWMHNGSVLVNKQKMGKSMNNDLSWRTALEMAKEIAGDKLGGYLLKATMLRAHWTQPLNWDSRLLAESFSMMASLTQGLSDSETELVNEGPLRNRYLQTALSMLNENFNVPAYFAWLHQQKKAGNTQQIAAGLKVLGLPALRWKKPDAPISQEHTMLQQRHLQARRNKDFALADALRHELQQAGVAPLNLSV